MIDVRQTIADFIAEAARGWVTTPIFTQTIHVIENEIDNLTADVSDLAADLAALELITNGCLSAAFAELSIQTATTISVAPGSTYTKAEIFTNTGENRGITADLVNNQLIIQKAGVYRITADFCTYSDTDNITLTTGIFLNGSELPNMHIRRKFGNASDVSSGHTTGIVYAEVGDTIDVRCYHNQAGSITLTVQYGNLGATYIGSRT